MRLRPRAWLCLCLCLCLCLGPRVTAGKGSRISWGTAVAVGELPFAVKIETVKGESVFACTGAIINDRWVITAAHCVVLEDGKTYTVVNPSSLTVRAGYRKEKTFDKEYKVTTFDYNKKYPGQKDHDVALLKTKDKISYSDVVNKIYLSPHPKFKIGRRCVALGFGRTSDASGATYGKLLKTNVKLIECRAPGQYGCFKGANPASNICSGDSGGPLVCAVERGYIQIAVSVSTSGPGSGDCEKEGTYSKGVPTGAVKDWIIGNAGREVFMSDPHGVAGVPRPSAQIAGPALVLAVASARLAVS